MNLRIKKKYCFLIPMYLYGCIRVYIMKFWLCVWLVQFSKLFVVDFVPNQNLCYIYTWYAKQSGHKKWPNNNQYNSGLCVIVPKFAILSQQYNETSIIIIFNSKN